MTFAFNTPVPYRANAVSLKSPRLIEYEALARVTSALRGAEDIDPPNWPRLLQAVDDNRKLWTAFMLDLAEGENALPQALRAQLVELALFTISHSQRVVAGKASTNVLQDINVAIMRGLEAGDV